MARSDFQWVWIRHDFVANAPTITREFSIEGNQAPIGDAYLLIQTRGVSQLNHVIKINNEDLPGIDLVAAPGESGSWLLWMKHVPPNFLKLGRNTITVVRIANDNFEIGGIAVNWREP